MEQRKTQAPGTVRVKEQKRPEEAAAITREELRRLVSELPEGTIFSLDLNEVIRIGE